MGPTDFVLASLILLASVAVLIRSFRRSGGPCAGCSGGGCGQGAPAPQVVTLRRPRRD